jgi:hypothetical protein
MPRLPRASSVVKEEGDLKEKRVAPVIRLFGVHAATGARACVHVHGFFPYFYIKVERMMHLFSSGRVGLCLSLARRIRGLVPGQRAPGVLERLLLPLGGVGEGEVQDRLRLGTTVEVRFLRRPFREGVVPQDLPVRPAVHQEPGRLAPQRRSSRHAIPGL